MCPNKQLPLALLHYTLPIQTTTMILDLKDVVRGQHCHNRIKADTEHSFCELEPRQTFTRYVQENEIAGVFFFDEFGNWCIYRGKYRGKLLLKAFITTHTDDFSYYHASLQTIPSCEEILG